jgi:hypothetical protein
MEDSDRAIRTLRKKGVLTRVGQGIYRFEPADSNLGLVVQFSDIAKNAVFERDEFTCTECLQAAGPGCKLYVAFVVEPTEGGRATVSNGRTLCSRHLLVDQLMKKLLPTSSLASNLQKVAGQLGDFDSEKESRFWNALLDVVANFSPLGNDELERIHRQP